MSVDYAVRVNDHNKAVELNLNPKKVGQSPQEGAHMRAFWAATISFFFAFLGWFALAPIAVDVAKSIRICENQLYPPAAHPRRMAFLKYATVESKVPYCTYGKDNDDAPSDCKDSTDPAEVALPDYSKYNEGVLPSCVCTPGTHCSDTLLYSSIGSVAVTIFVRVALGTLLERYGPVNVQAALLIFGSVWVFAAVGISNEWTFILVRTMIGCVGATFVTNQFWCSLVFAPSIVGTANATAAGWGNMGGGVAQVFIVWCLFKPLSAVMSENAAWRLSMTVPGLIFLIVAATVKLTCWDTPTAVRFKPADTGKNSQASIRDYIACLKDPCVLVMIFQYSACFGTELAMNAQLATHFRVYFELKKGDAAALASCFGLMNLFARSLGGITSDVLFSRFGFRGRLWAQFAALFLEGIFLLCFGFVDNSQEWYVALIALVFFSLFVQMAEGTSYGIVPFMIPEQLACVSALVGAGGNLGSVIALWCFYKPLGQIHALLPFKVHAAYVLVNALTSVVYYWPDKGGLFVGPSKREVSGVSEDKMEEGEDYVEKGDDGGAGSNKAHV